MTKKYKTKRKRIKLTVGTKKKKHPTIKKLEKMTRKELKEYLIKEKLVNKNTKAPKKVLMDILLASKTNNINIIRT